jgi:hypothetical protein
MSTAECKAGGARQRSRAAPLLAALGALICLAPTPGDIGGCGQAAEDLDPATFYLSKQTIECDRCRECRIRTPACEAACSAEPVPTEFPEGCFPLVHDGTVCLRALTRASCDDHREFSGEPPSVPSECNFCPER